tara:strand:+ start:337 stop:555 length:219 start_codon:yes stop_codon:yes gene_type:complete
MNLISCPNCGVVYDADHIFFPGMVYKDVEDENGSYTMIDDTKAIWDNDYDAYFPKVDCRICGTAVQSKKRVD